MSTGLHSRSRHARRMVPTYDFKGITISVYRSKQRFSAQFVVNRVRHRFERTTEIEAVEAAREQVRRMQDTKGQDVLLQEQRAEEILRKVDLSVIEAAHLMAAYVEKLRSHQASLGDAVDYFLRAHEGTPVTVTVLVDELLTIKDRDTGYQNTKTLRSRLKCQFARAFGTRLLSTLKADELNRWILSRPGKTRTRRNYHSALVTLFEHGRDNGYLPRGRPTEMELVKKPKSGNPTILIFMPKELLALIKSSLEISSPALPALLIQCLAGVRTEELKQIDPKKDRLRWSDVWLNQTSPEIHIRVEVSKNGKERYIPLSPELTAWLRLLRLDGDAPVFPKKRLYDEYLKICRKAGITWKKNGPRKSFNTYDAALSRSLQVTAKAAGNSAAMISRYYKKELSQVGQVALDWFATGPGKFRAEIRRHLAHFKRAQKEAFTPTNGRPRRRLA